MTEDNELLQIIRCGDAHTVFPGEIIGGALDIGVGRFRFFGVDNVESVPLFHRAGIAFDLVCVKDKDHDTLFEPLIVQKNVHQHPTGGLQIDASHFLEFVPGVNDVVSVHQKVLGTHISGRNSAANGAFGRALGGGLKIPPFHFAIGSLKDGLQFLFLLAGGGVGHDAASGSRLGGCFCFLAQSNAAGNMGRGGNFVPFHGVARAVGAEDGIRAVFRVVLRFVADGSNDLFRIVTRLISSHGAGQTAKTAAVSGDGLPVVAHCGNGSASGDQRHIADGFRGIKAAAHLLDIVDSTAQIFAGDLQSEIVPRLQQYALRAHQTLPHGAIGGLAEIAALRVLQVSASGGERKAHICDGGSGENAQMRLFHQMREDQALPVAIQSILTADGGEFQPAALRQRLKKQMSFGVVAQRLVMAYAFHGGRDRFFIDDAACAELHSHAKPFGNDTLQDLELHLPHKQNMDLLQTWVPGEMELGILLLKLAQLGQRRCGIHAVGQDKLIVQNRFQRGGTCVVLAAQSHADLAVRQSGDYANAAGGSFVGGLEFGAGINADLVDLFLPWFAVADAGEHLLDAQCAAGDFEMGQALSLGITGDLVDSRAKALAVFRTGRKAFQNGKEILHAVQLQSGAETAGENLSPCNKCADPIIIQRSFGKVLLHGAFVAHGCLLAKQLR